MNKKLLKQIRFQKILNNQKKAYDNEAIKDPELNKKRFLNACEKKNYNKILELIDKVPNIATLTKKNKNVILILGVPTDETYHKHIAIISELLKKGCDINYKNSLFGINTILYKTCSYLESDTTVLNFIKFLIDCKANTNETNYSTDTALGIACSNYRESINIVSLLIDNKANIECKINSEYTPLLYTCKVDRFSTFNILIEKGANIYATDNRG